MARKIHQNKHIEMAIKQAEAKGWRVIETGKSSHAWGRLLCPETNRNGCQISIWSTPRNPENHAKQIIQFVIKCEHGGKKMKTYNFTLVLSGKNEPDDNLENILFENGCDDATLCFLNGIPYLEFDRENNSFQTAVISAIQQVEDSHCGLKVERVEPDDLITIEQIADRLNKTQEYIYLLNQGKINERDFPHPIGGTFQQSLYWSWKQVAQWCFNHNLIEEETVIIAQNIADINYVLFYRSDRTAFTRIEKLSQLLSVA